MAKTVSGRDSRVHRIGLGAAAMILGILVAAPLISEERILLDPVPRWVVSGTWSADGQTLWLVDAFQSTVLGYDLEGRRQELHPVPQGSLAFSRPSLIQPWRDGFLIEQEGTGFVHLDKAFGLHEELITLMNYPTALRSQAAARTRPGDPQRSAQIEMVGIYGWKPLEDGGRLFGLAEFLIDGKGWTGFAHFAPDAPDRAHRVFEIDPASKDFYLLGMQLITSLNGTGYALLMDGKPRILAIDGEGQPQVLPLIPEGLQSLPALQDWSLGNLSQLYTRLAQTHMVAGLYGWNDRLYLLSRSFQWDKNDCRWTLTRIDPERQRIEATLHIPTKAPHLTVIPGDEYWAFVEKGTVKGFGRQAIPSMLLMSADEFRGVTPGPAEDRRSTELTAAP